MSFRYEEFVSLTRSKLIVLLIVNCVPNQLWHRRMNRVVECDSDLDFQCFGAKVPDSVTVRCQLWRIAVRCQLLVYSSKMLASSIQQ